MSEMTATTAQWYYSQHGRQRGPVPLPTLQHLLQSGELPWSEIVWTGGMASWAPAATVPQLRPAPSTPGASPGRYPPPLPPPVVPYASPPAAGHYPGIEADPKMRMLIPVGRSPWAIVAGYLGLLSPLLIFAPLALIFSIIAIRDIRRRDTHGMGRAVFGLVMGGVFSVLLCVAVATVVMNEF